MEGFRKINASELDNAFEMIGKEWMLICVNDAEQGRLNAMTASWGAFGVLWNKKVCICFVRPQRHTHKLLESEERFSIAFFGDEHRDALNLCGRESGRDADKLALCGLGSAECDGVAVVPDSRAFLICKKLYEDELKEECFIDPSVSTTYSEKKDFHTFYVCEIEAAYLRDSD